MLLGIASGCSHSPESFASHRGHEYQYELAEKYRTGDGVERDIARAIYWYEKASVSASWTPRGKIGNRRAMLKLAEIYKEGEGVPVNYERAVHWHTRYVEKTGSSWSMQAIATMYRTGGPGLPEDADLALSWYRRAADEGNHWAQYQVGEAYRKGAGVDKDASEAARWYEWAALQGNDWAQFRLSKSLRTGDGVPEDIDAANEWLRKAAEQGNPWAALTMGDFYRSGNGVDKDVTKSVEWYRIAADKGNEEAKSQLAKLGL
jgi:TPR repeat protein